MKDLLKYCLTMIWTIALVGLAYYLATVEVQKPSEVSGEFSLAVGQKMVLSSSVQIKAASADFFVLRSEDGNVVYGRKIAKPLGWAGDYYWVEAQLEKGLWEIETANNTVYFDSSAPVVAHHPSATKTLFVIAVIIVAIMVWLIGLCLIL